SLMKAIEVNDIKSRLDHYIRGQSYTPLFICGDVLATLKEFPSETIDCCMTSPPYWNQREYESGGNGLEQTPEQYLSNLLVVIAEVKRVLKPTGSFWLNLGDTYQNKGLTGIPWRLAVELMDRQQWILRNEVIWHKIKGPDNAHDKLRNVHEQVFH